MSKVMNSVDLDQGTLVAREREDVIVGNEIVRHKLASRLIHWSVALTFFGGLLTGLPIWSPVFGWMAHLVGGLSVARVIHPWLGLAFAVASLFMAVHWWGSMEMTKQEKGWLGANFMGEMRAHLDETGKYNAGQKLYFHTSGLGALGLLVTGIVMWFPTSFPAWARQISYLLHDVSFILFAVSLVLHIYLATVAEPGTFESMTRGTVSKMWAKLHHPRWYRQLMGLEK